MSYRNYGFWATDVPPVKVYNEPTLDAHTDHNYAGFNMGIPDQTRFAEWLQEFQGYVDHNNLPTVEFLKFPRDHTCGTSTSCPTPKAMVADSDWATGTLVDAVSHSKYWASTAIFVIEDDAQDGPDHVDAHRTIGHVISPYTQLDKVDSTFYSSTSMLRTIELILGLPPLSQFDATAHPLTGSFTDAPNRAPYDAIEPEQSLTEPNPGTAPLSAASDRMDFTREDRAPQHLLNMAIWKSVKGAATRMPQPRHALHVTEEPDGRVARPTVLCDRPVRRVAQARAWDRRPAAWSPSRASPRVTRPRKRVTDLSRETAAGASDLTRAA